MLYPSMKASPDVTVSSPVSILKVVVFPAPLKPKRPKHSPFPTARDSLSTARILCPLLYTWQGQTTGGLGPHLRISEADMNLNNEASSHLAQLLQDERTSNHRLNNWLTLQNPLPLLGYVSVLGKERCILYERQLDTNTQNVR